jgi:hypothetical protein
MSTWRVTASEDPQSPLAHVTFREGRPGDPGDVVIQADNVNVREFLSYYLDDPLDQCPVYLHGLGYRHGPHTADREQFDHAMSTLSHHFPAYRAEPVDPAD